MVFCHVAVLFLGTLLALLCGFSSRYMARRFRRPRGVRLAGVAVGAVSAIVSAISLGLLSTGRASSLASAFTLLVPAVASAGFLAFLAERRIHTEPAARPRRILAIGAHPDDLELACGGTLAKLADAGHEIHALVMSDGAVGGDREIRIGEAQRGADFMGLASIEVHDFPDTALEKCSNAMRQCIEDAIERYQPHIIFTHSCHDQHQDHAAVHLATLRAGRQHHSILCYESPSTTREFNPSFFVEIDDYLATKVSAVLTHRNQAGKPYMTPERVRGMAVFRGGQAKGQPAEAFEPVRLAAASLGVLF